MRTLRVVENLSLDGVMQAPEKWAFAYQSADMTEVNRAGMQQSDALLLGRVTYQEFASYWPHQSEDPAGMVKYLNSVAKYVVSRALKDPDWSNTTVLSGSLVEQIAQLKAQPGQDITVIGSATLVARLAQAGLVDEYQFWIFPLALGAGRRLFEGSAQVPMTLVHTQSFDSGVALLTYRPAKEH